MKCPVCDVELQMTERLGVEIDYCIKCRGMWLDRGELDKIIERSVDHDEDRPEHVEQYDDRRTYPPSHHKRRSRLGEIFDFFD